MNYPKSFTIQFSSINDANFDQIALELFHFQALNNNVYAQYLKARKISHSNIKAIRDIPFLPISFFKSKEIKTASWQEEGIFQSSGTTGEQTSRHFVRHVSEYLENAQNCFEQFYGPLNQYHFFALLPSYLERENSSLVVMMDHFIKRSESKFSGFYLYNTDEMLRQLDKARVQKRKIILWGVSFALLDLAEQYNIDLSDCLILETGGMKGRRVEITRQELHTTLSKAFKADVIHAEYGMTEMMSQAYSLGRGIFCCPRSMKILVRDINDPFNYVKVGKTGGINVIDLANFHTCAFIETEDLGKCDFDGNFEVLGRFDQSDIRGCNLLLG